MLLQLARLAQELQKATRLSHVCRCKAYGHPHRRGGGKCSFKRTEGVERSDLNKTLTQFQPGAHEDGYHDYTSVLGGRAREGYTLHVGEPFGDGAGFHAILRHGGQQIGTVWGGTDEGGVTPHSNLDEGHHGKKLGVAMYQALLSHALRRGFRQVQGGGHTEAASRVHQALARRHGLDYRPTDDGGQDGDKYPFGPYKYVLKRELRKATPPNPADHPFWVVDSNARFVGGHGTREEAEAVARRSGGSVVVNRTHRGPAPKPSKSGEKPDTRQKSAPTVAAEPNKAPTPSAPALKDLVAEARARVAPIPAASPAAQPPPAPLPKRGWAGKVPLQARPGTLFDVG